MVQLRSRFLANGHLFQVPRQSRLLDDNEMKYVTAQSPGIYLTAKADHGNFLGGSLKVVRPAISLNEVGRIAHHVMKRGTYCAMEPWAAAKKALS